MADDQTSDASPSDEFASPRSPAPTNLNTNSDQTPHSSPSQSLDNPPPPHHSLIETLSAILPSLPPSLSSSPDPASSLLHDHQIASQISALLRRPDSGVGDDHLCRWLYDAFQSSDPNNRLVVLRFLPTLAGVYLTRVAFGKPLAGFEAVLLALYAHETAARDGKPITATIPDLSNPSIYHDPTTLSPPATSASTSASPDPHIAVVSPSLEPYGTVRATRRARIVGVGLELYYSKIDQMPIGSKIDFCGFCQIWSGQDGEMFRDGDEEEDKGSEMVEGNGERRGEVRIPLPWELLQPVLRILGHCLLGQSKSDGDDEEGKLKGAAAKACRSVYARALHDVDARAILATQSLLRLGKMASANAREVWDPTEIPETNVISL